MGGSERESKTAKRGRVVVVVEEENDHFSVSVESSSVIVDVFFFFLLLARFLTKPHHEKKNPFLACQRSLPRYQRAKETDPDFVEWFPWRFVARRGVF